MQLKFNQQQTNIYNTQATYVQYKKWLFQNGVIVDPRLRYPTYFGQKGKGVVGISTTKAIEKGKVVIAVPYDLLITMDKVMNIQVLDKIINQNPDVFGVSQHVVMKMLILYVCYELLKQKQSFYYPYFQISKGGFLQKWTHWQMTSLQNKQLMKALKRQKQQLQLFFLQFLRLFTKYDNVFPIDKGNAFYQKLFQRAYSFVTTRAFGWSLPSISLIPMADSLNHGNNYLNHYLIDVQQQKNPSEEYISRKNKSNLSIFKKKHLMPSQNVLNQLRKKKKRRFQKFIQKHREIIESSAQLGQLSNNPKIQNLNQRNKQFFILCEQYKAQVRNFRQLNFYQSSCSQDNDTDEDQLTQFTVKREKFQFDQKYKAQTIQKEKGKAVPNKKNTLNQYWKLWIDNALEQQEQQSDQQKQQQKLNKQEQKQRKQILQNYQLKGKQSQGSSSVSSTQSQEDDQNFDWMKKHTQKKHESSYFVMQTKNIIRQNEQLHNFYGRRTNRFLLQSYNFVMSNNQYDSFGFRLYIDQSINVKPNTIEKLVYLVTKKQTKNKGKCSLSKQIRLKSKRLNIELLNHCRCYTIQFQKKQFDFITVTKPFDRQVQLKALKMYRQIVQALKGQYMTSIQEDEELLEKTAQHQLKTAISYRIMQKHILNAQSKLVDQSIDFLNKKWKNGRIQKPTWKDLKSLVPLRQYIKSLQRGKLQ